MNYQITSHLLTSVSRQFPRSHRRSERSDADALIGAIAAELQLGVPLDHVISPDTVRGPRSSTVQAISFNSLWTCKLQPDSDFVQALERRLGPGYAIRKPSQRLSAQRSTLLSNFDAMSLCGADRETYRRRGASSCCS